jgi:hypothetical protein
MANTTYTIKKAKKQGDKTFYQEVGKLLIRESGKNGVLFLHFLDGEFAVFVQEPKARPEGAGDQ